MGIFTRSIEKEDSRFTRLHNALSMAFHSVKRDINHLTDWTSYFHQKHQQSDVQFGELNQRLAQVEQRLAFMPSRDEIRNIIDSHYSYEPVLQKIESLKLRLDALEQRPQQTVQVHPRPVSNDSRVNIRERIVERIAKNSKDYVKSVVFGMIQKYGSISGPQLKEIVVKEQGLASKSSFYRILQELEDDGQISVIQRGKEKTYLLRSTVIQK